MQARRIRWVGAAAIGMLALFATLSLLPVSGSTIVHEGQAPHDRIETVARDHAPSDRRQPSATVSGTASRADTTLPAPEREALRRAILASAHAHTHGASHGPAHDDVDPAAASHAGQLTDRTDGADPALLTALDADFMPLADECMTAARQANPELRGMVAMGLELAADDDLGAVIETVEFPARNEIEDAELQTCLRETALSMILPPSTDGHAQLLLTLPLDDTP